MTVKANGSRRTTAIIPQTTKSWICCSGAEPGFRGKPRFCMTKTPKPVPCLSTGRKRRLALTAPALWVLPCATAGATANEWCRQERKSMWDAGADIIFLRTIQRRKLWMGGRSAPAFVSHPLPRNGRSARDPDQAHSELPGTAQERTETVRGKSYVEKEQKQARVRGIRKQKGPLPSAKGTRRKPGGAAGQGRRSGTEPTGCSCYSGTCTTCKSRKICRRNPSLRQNHNGSPWKKASRTSVPHTKRRGMNPPTASVPSWRI